MSAADEIKSRLDIIAYIQQYVPLKKAGRSFKACCPWHSERTPSFVVDPERQTFRCFGACATGGDIISFAMRQHGWSFGEALQELGQLAGVEVRPQTPEQRSQSDQLDRLRGLLESAADAFHEALFNDQHEGARAARRYATEKRAFSLETIRQFRIGYALPDWQAMLDHLKGLGYSEEQIIEAGLAARNESGRVYDRFRSRLVIPIRDERGRVIGFGARALDPDDNPKYLNSPQTPLFDKSRVLFGLDAARGRIRDTETAVIVEGYMDAIQAHQAGFTNVVAQMGTAITETQLKILARTATKIILALDSDAAGQSATRRSLEVARATLQADFSGRLSVDLRVLQIPDAKDPDDLIREQPDRWQELVANALPVADYVIEMETSGLSRQASLAEREAIARRLLPILLASENNLYKKDNLQKLALRLRIPEGDLLAWAADQQRIAAAKAPRRPASTNGNAQPAPQADALEPPDWPALDEADYVVPPADTAGSAPAPLVGQPVERPEIADEIYCLRMLFRQPVLYYRVNRRFRELAAGDRALAEGPLRDWDAGDFSQSDTQALMEVFEAALSQDEHEPLDYVRANVRADLQSRLERIMMDDLDDVRLRLRTSLTADLADCWRQNQRGGVDVELAVVGRALRLRSQRLWREREDLRFLQMDVQEDDNARQAFSSLVILSQQAKLLIDAELQRQMTILRR